MVDGYLDDPETTAEKFKDGWFHPGDYGRLTPDGLLLIEGRIDDVINIGGVKLSAARMEETALECQGVQDAAAAVFPMASGRWAVHFAIVPAADFNPAQLKAAISSTYGVPPVVTILDAIPRNSMQKVQRDRLREAILEKARPSAGETAGG